MTEQQHPITPPPELVMKWWDDGPIDDHIGLARYMADQASRWGSDQELEACCEWLGQNCGRGELFAALRAARRPKPPSLKEQALEELRKVSISPELGVSAQVLDIIGRALEQLDD